MYTPPVRKYAIFDIAENRFLLAQNAPKSFVAGLRPDPLVSKEVKREFI